MSDMSSEEKNHKISTNQLIKTVMLAHCEQLPAWVIWECMWNERRKAAVKAVKSRGCIKASTVIYKRVRLGNFHS